MSSDNVDDKHEILSQCINFQLVSRTADRNMIREDKSVPIK
jgi:hypothetical protein